jgi:hypothetical protein
MIVHFYNTVVAPSISLSARKISSPERTSSSPGDCTLSLRFISRVEHGPDFQNMSLCQSMHFRHCKASTTSPFRQLWHLLMEIPADKKAHSLNTEDAIIGR